MDITQTFFNSQENPSSREKIVHNFFSHLLLFGNKGLWLSKVWRKYEVCDDSILYIFNNNLSVINHHYSFVALATQTITASEYLHFTANNLLFVHREMKSRLQQNTKVFCSLFIILNSSIIIIHQVAPATLFFIFYEFYTIFA